MTVYSAFRHKCLTVKQQTDMLYQTHFVDLLACHGAKLTDDVGRAQTTIVNCLLNRLYQVISK